MQPDGTVPRSLVWATEIDVLPPDRVVTRRDGYLVVRSPGNPGHYWGNLLLFDEPPGPGDGERWERAFDAEFADSPGVRHRTLAWDRADGELGMAREELGPRCYDLEHMVGLVAGPGEVRPHPRADTQARVRPLDPAPGADAALWRQVIELWVAAREPRFGEQEHRDFARARLAELRRMFLAGRGAWYVALLGDEVAGSLGVVVTEGRGRYQAVDTAAAHRRRGICSRLVVEAALDAERRGARRLVICADPGYHALGLYESLGFRRAERSAGACMLPASRRPA